MESVLVPPKLLLWAKVGTSGSCWTVQKHLVSWGPERDRDTRETGRQTYGRFRRLEYRQDWGARAGEGGGEFLRNPAPGAVCV